MAPAQLRVNGDPAVRTTSVWFGRSVKSRWIDGGSGRSETKKNSGGSTYHRNTDNDGVSMSTCDRSIVLKNYKGFGESNER